MQLSHDDQNTRPLTMERLGTDSVAVDTVRRSPLQPLQSFKMKARLSKFLAKKGHEVGRCIVCEKYLVNLRDIFRGCRYVYVCDSVRARAKCCLDTSRFNNTKYLIGKYRCTTVDMKSQDFVRGYKRLWPQQNLAASQTVFQDIVNVRLYYITIFMFRLL